MAVGSTQPVTQPSTQAFAELRPPSTSRIPTTQLSINFRDATVDAVLEYLADAAGFEILKEIQVEGRVTVFSPQPVSADEAVVLLNAVLKTNGYTAVRQGRLLKIMSRDKAKKSNVPVYFGNDWAKIAETDELITQVIPVQKIDAVKLKQDLQGLIGTDADFAANAGSNTVVITDAAANIRRVVQIISSMDKNDPATVDIKVVTLKYADATSTAKLITDVFKTDDTSQNNQNGNRNDPIQQIMRARFGGGGPGGGGAGGAGGGGRGGAGGADSEEKGKAAKIVAAADPRTNTIVITGPAETLAVITKVIDQLDSDPTSNSTIFTYNLKNAQASTLEPVLNNLFGNSSSGSSSNSTRRTTNTNTTSTGFGSSSSGSAFGGSSGGSSRSGGSSSFGGSSSGSSPFGSTSGFGSNTGGSVSGGGSSLSSNGQRASNDLAGQVYVVANTDTNSLLVQCATKYLDKVKGIIQELDRPVPQVLIKVLIAEVSHDNSEDLGVDFSVLNKNGAGRGVAVGSTLGTAAAATSGGLVVSLVERDLTATLRAIATAGKLDVLSRPYILASDNQQASITVGQEVPFITDTRTDALGGQINTIQYQDIGIILNVIPHINPEGLVIMDVAPEISQLTGTTVPISSTVNAPVFAKRSAQTRVAIQDGRTIVIGGLMQDTKTSTLTKVPFLGDIPGLGLIFQRRETTKNKTELLIFITPHVAQEPTSLQRMSEDEMKGTKLTPNAVEPGTFDDHLRGMQRGTTRPSNDLLPPAP